MSIFSFFFLITSYPYKYILKNWNSERYLIFQFLIIQLLKHKKYVHFVIYLFFIIVAH